MIKLAFSDPWNTNDITPLYNLLKDVFDIKVSTVENADYLIYSDFGIRHQNFKGVKIFITEENHPPRPIECDYAFTHERLETERFKRLPCWLFNLIRNDRINTFNSRPIITKDDLNNTPKRFANFVYRNHVCKTRNNFFKTLSKYKHVDAAGSLMNNMENGWRVPGDEHLKFLSKYKFTISFENESHKGYTTEKIINPLIARSVPIYWGNPCVTEEFNPKAFINYFDYKNEKELIEHIIEIDNNDELFLSYLNAQPFIKKNQVADSIEAIIEQFKVIFSNPDIKRSNYELSLFKLDKILGRSALKRYKEWKHNTFKKK